MSKVKQTLWQEPEHDESLYWGTNMNINELSNSKFIKKEEVDPAVLVTIARIENENVAKDNEKPDLKYTLYFNELEKPLVLNQTNGIVIARICKSEESDGWIGKKIVLFNDPTIMFAGEVKGGIRVREPKNQPQQTATPNRPAPTENIPDDDIPF